MGSVVICTCSFVNVVELDSTCFSGLAASLLSLVSGWAIILLAGFLKVILHNSFWG